MTQKVNLRNMPENLAYKIGEGRYVWKVKRKETLNGNYPSQQASTYTEVFVTNGENEIYCECSGRLTTNPGVYDYRCLDKNGNFHIFDYDADCGYSFHQDGDLEEAKKEIQEYLMGIYGQDIEVEKSKGIDR